MLKRANRLLGVRVNASDGFAGTIKDFYLDDETWSIRYVSLATGGWLSQRQVLISTVELKAPLHDDSMTIDLSRALIENSPIIASRGFLSRWHEIELCEYYGWRPYWPLTLAGFTGVHYASVPVPVAVAKNGDATRTPKANPHLHKALSVEGYHVQACDGDIGEVGDFITETDGWIVRYLVVETNELDGDRDVLVAPGWIRRADWLHGNVSLEMSREKVKDSPVFDLSGVLTHEDEARLYDYYGQPYYWR